MTWINTDTNEDASNSSIQFWESLRIELKNEGFWADKIKELRGEPTKRLKMALDNLPLPAAFREGAVATRALIREKRKQKKEYKDELALLYWLAAIDSFSIAYSPYLDQPGYNVIESIPGSVIRTLSFSYFELGYKRLPLLNNTDVKWFIEAWGEPHLHTSLHELHKDVWKKYERELPAKQKRQLAEVRNEDILENRVLCSDGNCIGVIGPDGRCGVCGKP